MRINKSELRVCVDIDGTLVRRLKSDFGPEVDVARSADYYGAPHNLIPYKDHVELVKSYKKRGYEVTVWSANGWQWAKNVIESLGLTEYVDIVETKPLKYVDDKPADEWMQRIFIQPGDQ